MSSIDPCGAASPRSIFDEAVELDLADHADRAFAEFLSAAEQGLPEAEFNVAVMLDAGRGTNADALQAAVWYARAAAHGDRRAAYNLALLYENGQAVPKNSALARAWFIASHLKASSSHLTALAKDHHETEILSPPSLVFPEDNAKTFASNGTVEVVWTAQMQPRSVEYLVELRASVGDYGKVDVLSAPVTTSSLLMALPTTSGQFQWRVAAISRKSGDYQRSAWFHFSVDGPP